MFFIAKTKFTVDLDLDDSFSDFEERIQDEDSVPSDVSPHKAKASPKYVL